MTSCFFFNDTATTEIYTLSLHDALPIPLPRSSRTCCVPRNVPACEARQAIRPAVRRDRKSTRLNSSHTVISYAVFCLKQNKAQLQLLLHDEELLHIAKDQ